MAAGAFVVLPEQGLGRASVFLGLMTLSLALLGRAVRRLPAGRRRPWLVLLAGEGVYAVASFARYLLPPGRGATVAYPSVVDGAFLCSYALFGAFLLLVLLGDGGPRRVDVGGVTLDALVAAGAAGAVVQAWLVEPVMTAPGAGGLAVATSIAYPVLMVGLLALCLQLVVGGTLKPGPGSLLVAWIGGELVSDVWYARSSLAGSFHHGHPMFIAWMASYVALGAFALHPGFAGPSAGTSRMSDPRRRVVILGAAVAVAFGLLAADAHPVRTWQHTGRVAWLAGVLVLVLARARVLVGDVAEERRLRADVERLAAELEHAATHDALTGLANRAYFQDALARALLHRREESRPAPMLLVDLSAVKAVNDTYGHAVGDDLLCEVARRLRTSVRGSDVVARLGGDEFALVPNGTDVRSALAIAERVVETMAEPVAFAGVEIATGSSVGVHVAGPDQQVSDVMACADAALYAAKACGGGFQVFDPARHRQFIERYRIELELRGASARGEMVLYYQPVVELTTRRVVGTEALIRWNHPTRGFLNPDAFIGIAEESGAIVEVGRWVIRQACADAKWWQDNVAGAEDVGVAVNVSRRQLLSPAVVDDISDALVASRLSPSSLTVEVTETALMADTDEIVGLLDRFRALGVVLAMDDFGTGYSSLAQLRSLPIDVLKIDKAFVDGIAREDEEWALAAAIIRLAGSLGKRTLAEGVERASQLAHLRSLGCELGQGYLFARPMPLAEVEQVVASRLAAT